jgi:autotransporter-associated beta strand protein
VFHRHCRVLGAALSLATGVLLAGVAHAQTTTWTGATNQDWNTATNWSSSPSDPTGDFIINTAAGNFPRLAAETFNFPLNLILADGGTNSGRFDHRTGTLQLLDPSSGTFSLGRAASTATATYNLANTATVAGGISGFATGDGNMSVGKFYIGGSSATDTGTTAATFNMNTTGTLTANSVANVNGGVASLAVGFGAGNTGVINLENGNLTTVGQMWLGTQGVGTVNQTGGVVNVGVTGTDGLLLSRNINNAQAGSGTWNISGTGVLNSEGDMVLSYAGNSSAIGTMNINAGGTVNVASTVERWLKVSQFDAGQSVLNVNGGTLNLNANTDLRFSTGGNGRIGTSVVNLNSGAITSYSSNQTGSTTTGLVDLNQSANNTTVSNTFNLNGGTLTVQGVITSQNNGNAVFNFNGGLLKASNNNTGFFVLGGANQRANVRNGGAKIDTNGDPVGVPAGFNVTIAESLQHSNIGGDNAIDGGLTKSGVGTLTLSTGTHTYTGPTVVNGGTLQVNAGLNATGGVSVNAGSTFQGQGTVAGTTTLNGGTLANTSTTTALTLNALTLGAGANAINLNLTTNTPGIVATTLTTGANTATINPTKTIWDNGLNNLIGYTTFNGGLGNFSVGTITGLNARQISGGLVNTGTGIALTINGDNPKWTGADNGNWVVGATGPNKNWVLVTGGGTTDYLEGDAVVFDDTASGTTTLDITSAAGVSPTSVVFNNTTKAYVINSASGGGINGTSSVTKNGTNSLTLNTANAYSGGTNFNGGSLNLGNAAALGTGRLTIGPGSAGKVLNNSSGAPIVSTANNLQTWNDDFTFSGNGTNDLDLGTGEVTIGGAGTDRTVNVAGGTLNVGELKAAAHGLVKNGAGTLILTSTGPNTQGSNLLGTLTVNAGTVQMNRTGAVGGDPSTGDVYVGGLAGTGTITNGAGQVRWLFVNQPASTSSTFDGFLENGAGGFGLGLNKQGLGSLTLTKSSGMTDLVTINNGLLNFSGAGALPFALGYTINAGAGVFQVSSSSQVSAGAITIQSDGNGALVANSGSTARLEVSGGSTLNNPIFLAPRNDVGGAGVAASDHIRSTGGNNTLTGLITIQTGGNFTRIRSDVAGQSLTLSGGITTTATSNRNVYLQGVGNGEVSGAIADAGTGIISVFKEGSGTWTLSGFNTNSGLTAVFQGTLSITQADSIADLGDVSVFSGGILNLTSGTQDTIDAFYINGVAKQPGLYGAIGNAGVPVANQTALITGSGILNVSRYDLPGDFDNNNMVDAADLAVWRAGMAAGNATGDTNGDGVSNGADFLLWQRFLGATNPAVAATAAVPEPGTLAGALLASIALAGFRRQRRA